MWCGDFTAHSSLWGDHNDENGMVIEDLMESENLVCPIDGRSTSIKVQNQPLI